MALKLAADGWILCLIDRDADGLAALGKERPMIGASLKTYAVDVTQQRELEAAINAFCKAYGGVDLLVNSAGIGLAGQADQVSTGDWRLLFDVNVVAVGSATAAVLPHMRAANSGYIVNIASAAAYHCLPGIGAYSASKAAVVALTENLVAELAGTSIKASVMISAFFKSSMPKHTLGGRQASELAAGLMALSAMTSEEAAEQTLRGMEERRTYILVGNQARVIYWLERLAPNLWLRLAPRVARKAFAKANAITASGGTQ
jgi:short-subunit dehydrogenase